MLQQRGAKALWKASLDWLFRSVKHLARTFLTTLNTLSPWPRTLPFFSTALSPNTYPSTPPPLHPPTHLLLLLFLCFSLTGCSVFNAGPPTAVVERAIAQKLEQTQGVLRSQLSTEESSSNPFQVGKVSVSRQHQVLVGSQAAVEVEGTYTLKGGTLSRRQRQQQRPFDLYLKKGGKTDQWLLLEPGVGTKVGESSWQAIPVS